MNFLTDNFSFQEANSALPAGQAHERGFELPGAFTGKVQNSAQIGWTKEDYALMWNDQYPADKIVLELSNN